MKRKCPTRYGMQYSAAAVGSSKTACSSGSMAGHADHDAALVDVLIDEVQLGVAG
jgi:small ligand-binding sensory domain FIST